MGALVRFPPPVSIPDLATPAAAAQIAATVAPWSRFAAQQLALSERVGERVAITEFMSKAQRDDVLGFTGSVDLLAAGVFQAAHDALPSTGGQLYFPRGKYKLDFTGVDVVSNPKIAMQITKPDVCIVGEGRQTIINMAGITAAQLNSGSGDPGLNATDAATVFNFQGISGGLIKDLHIIGTFAFATDPAITVGKARAKGVSVFNAQRILVSGVTGKGIAGNLVNFRGNSGTDTTSTFMSMVMACMAEECAENCFNFMGGTYECAFIGNYAAKAKYHGLESGTAGLVCCSNTFRDNTKYGVSQVGDGGVIGGNRVYASTAVAGSAPGGINLQYNSAQFNGGQNSLPGNHVVISGTSGTPGGSAFTTNGGCNRFIVTGGYYESYNYTAYINSNASALGCYDWALVGAHFKNAGPTYYPMLIKEPCARFSVFACELEGGDTCFKTGYTLVGAKDYASAESDDVYCSDFVVSACKLYNAATDQLYIQGIRFSFSDNICVPPSSAPRVGQVGFASDFKLTGNNLRNVSGTQFLSLSSGVDSAKRSIADNYGGGYDLKTTATVDPASVAAGATLDLGTFAITGATAGDIVEVTHDDVATSNSAYLTFFGRISTSGNVRCFVRNNHASAAVDLASGTLRIKVRKI